MVDRTQPPEKKEPVDTGNLETIRTSRARHWKESVFTGGNELRIYRSGSDLYPAMLDAIDQAQNTINLEVYIFRPDEIGDEFVDALCGASSRGVDVRFIIDAWGSFTISYDFLNRLDGAGVELIRYRPLSIFTGSWGWRRRDHRKLLTIDDDVGFVGGMNIGREYTRKKDGGLGIRDTHLELRGNSVHQLNDLFSYNWKNHHHARDEIFLSDRHSTQKNEQNGTDAKVRIIGGRRKEKNIIEPVARKR